MKNVNKVFSFIVLATVSSLFLSNSGGQASNYAGAPIGGGGNESYCTDCHGSFALDPTNLILTGIPASYVAGQTYPLTLTVTDASPRVRAGFQIVATNGSSATQIGVFSAPSGTRLSGSGRLIHQGTRDLNTTTSTASWTFNWTAPSSTLPANVVFYYVSVAGDSDGSWNGDVVHSGNSSAIPLGIELLAFNAAVQKNNQVKIDWQTATETDNKHFIIERKTANMPFFQDIATIKGHGTSTIACTYTYTDDASEVSDVAYYRLRQEDFDGKVSYSKVVSVALKTAFKVKVYPSIAKNGDVVTVETGDFSDKSTTIDIVNMAGQAVKIEKKAAYTEGVQFPIANLSAGRYIVRIRQNGQQNYASFVVQ